MRTGWGRPSRRDDVSRENTEASTLNDEQRLDWLCLIRSEHVGPRTFRALVDTAARAARSMRCPSWRDAAERPLLRASIRAKMPSASWPQ